MSKIKIHKIIVNYTKIKTTAMVQSKTRAKKEKAFDIRRTF